MRNNNLYFALGITLILVIGFVLSALTNAQVAAKFESEAASATQTAIPAYVVSSLQTAQQYIDSENWDAAIPVLEETIKLDPKSIKANQLLLQAYVGSEQLEVADAYVQDLIVQGEKITKTGERDWIDIVVVRYFESIRDFQSVIDYVENANPPVTTKAIDFSTGTAYFLSEEYENAQPYFLKIEAEQPDHEPTQFRLGQISVKLNEYDEAIEYLTHAHELNPERKENLYFRGQAYYELGMLEQAHDDFNKYAELGGNIDVSKYFE